MKVLKEHWSGGNPEDNNVLDYVSKVRTRLVCVCQLARGNLKAAQSKMKDTFGIKAQEHEFSVGYKALVLLSITGHPLKAHYHSPYEIIKRIDEVNYFVKTPD